MNALEEKILQLDNSDLTIHDFEMWVYQSQELEVLLTPDDYLELISLNYRSKFVRNQIEKIISKYVDCSKFETAKLKSLLVKAKEWDKDTGEILRSFYDMYCDGYYFLHDLGLGYGLACEVPLNSGANSWEELNDNEKNELINGFYPHIIGHIEKVLEWIDNNKIILTGKKNDLGHWEFLDYRTTEEQKSSILVEPKIQVKKKKWYEFWK